MNTMSLLSVFLGEKKGSASVAKERLQIILAHERGRANISPDYLPALQKELLQVVLKFVQIKPHDVRVNIERQDNLEILEVKIELPESPR